MKNIIILIAFFLNVDGFAQNRPLLHEMPDTDIPSSAILQNDTCRVQGYSEKFKLHYVNATGTIGNSIHGITGTYRLAVKDALRKAVRTYRNPLYSADGIVFRSPIGDGTLGGAATGSTENNWIDVY